MPVVCILLDAQNLALRMMISLGFSKTGDTHFFWGGWMIAIFFAGHIQEYDRPNGPIGANDCYDHRRDHEWIVATDI